MTGNAKDTNTGWTDPDDAPEWSDEVLERAARYDGETPVRAAQGTLTRRGRPFRRLIRSP